MRFNLKNHNCFWVYQNKTFFEEANGGFLWSPKYAKDGKKNPGYEARKEVHKGDIILHSYMGRIVAISKAKDTCYSAHRPSFAFNEWDSDGWKIDAIYNHLNRYLHTADYGLEIYKIQPNNGPMRSDGCGKQQYLCNVNQVLFDYIITKTVHAMTEQEKKKLLAFLDVEILPDRPVPKPVKASVMEIEDGCKVDAIIVGENKKATLTINTEKLPNQKAWLGKKAGDILKTASATLSYRVERIYKEE